MGWAIEVISIQINKLTRKKIKRGQSTHSNILKILQSESTNPADSLRWRPTLLLTDLAARIFKRSANPERSSEVIWRGLIQAWPENLEKIRCYPMLQTGEIEIEAVSGVSKGASFVEGSNSRESGKYLLSFRG